MSSTYYTLFSFKAVGLDKVLSEFRTVASEIEAQSKTLGTMSFTGLDKSLPILKNINNTLMLMANHFGALSSAEAKAAAGMNEIAGGATKASAATKQVESSMSQLQTVAGLVSGAVSRATGAFGELAAVGKSAFSGIISGGKSAVGVMGELTAAAGRVSGAVARAGAMAAAPFAGVKGLGMATAPLAASALSMLAPGDVALLGAGYGAYTGMNIEKYASEAAAKSWQPGMSQATIDSIKQSVMQLARSQAGESIFSPTDFSQALAEYAGMGGNVVPGTPGALTESGMKGFANYAQAINATDIGSAINDLISQNLVWFGQQGAFNEKNLQLTEDMSAMLVAQTKLKAEDLSDLLKNVSPVSKAYGMSQAETYAMAGGLAQLGLSPEQAGMALRRVLLRGTPNVSDLQKQEAYNMGITNEKGQIIDPETGKAISLSNVNKAMDQLGLTWEQINPEQNKSGVVGVFQDIAKKMKEQGMTPEEQQAWMKTVYGLQGVTPAQLLTQNPEYLTDLYNKMLNSSGAAAAMSAIQVDNLEGSLKFLKTAFQGTAAGISDYVNPSLRKFSDFLRKDVIPGINDLGSDLAKGDWSAVADDIGGAFDFIKDKLAGSGEGVKNFINGGIDALDEFAGRLADFASGGGVRDLLGGLGDWAKNIWDNIDWGQVDNIINNLSTAFGAAWDQSMTWLENALNKVDWDWVGTKLGKAVEVVGGWVERALMAVPWGTIAQKLADAILAAVSAINWSAAFSGAMTAAYAIGQAIYNGVANSGIGTLISQIGYDLEGSVRSTIANLRAEMTLLPSEIGDALTGFAGGVAGSLTGSKGGTISELQGTTNSLSPGNYQSPSGKFFAVTGNGEVYAISAMDASQARSTSKAYLDISSSIEKSNQEMVSYLDTQKSSTPTQTSAPTSAVGSGKFDTMTGQEIPKGSPIWQSQIDKGFYVGSEGYKLLDAQSLKNYQSIGVASEGWGLTSAQQTESLVNQARLSGVLGEMYFGQEFKSQIGTSVTPSDFSSLFNKQSEMILQTQQLTKEQQDLQDAAYGAMGSQAPSASEDTTQGGLGLKDIANDIGMGAAKILNPSADRILEAQKKYENTPRENAAGEMTTPLQDQLKYQEGVRQAQQDQLAYTSQFNSQLAELAKSKNFEGMEQWFDDFNKAHPSAGLPDKNAADFERADQYGKLDEYLKQLTSMINPADRPKDYVDKNLKETKDNTKETANNTKDLVTDTKLNNDSLKNLENLFREKGMMYDQLQPQAQAQALDNIYTGLSQVAKNAMTIGNGIYGGAVRIGYNEQGQETAVIGSVRQRSWQEEGKTWADGLGDVGPAPVALDLSEAQSSWDTFKTTAETPITSKDTVESNAETIRSQIMSLNGLNTSSTHTIYNVTVNSSSGGSGGGGPGIPISSGTGGTGVHAPPVQGQPAYAEGGYTDSYGGPATVHPHEIILNAAQQRHVASEMNRVGRGLIHLIVNAQGAIFSGNGGIDELIHKIKEALQDDSYR